MNTTRNRCRLLAVLLAMIGIMGIASSAVAGEHEGSIIREVVVTGASRTDVQVVLRQLPFTTGDEWKEEHRALTLKRLAGMDLFDPLNLKVTVEPLEAGTVRVVVRVSDPHVLYNDPIEFAVVHGQELLSNSFSQTLRNPFGNGMNLSVGGRWGGSTSVSAGADFSLSRGWVAQLDYAWSDVHPGFYARGALTPEYSSTGSTAQASATRYATSEWTYGLTVGYRQADVSINGGAEAPQGYLQVAPRIGFSDILDASLTLRAAFDVMGGDRSYQSAVGKLGKAWEPDRHYLGLIAYGGYMTPDAPLNQQFTMGGFGTLPLRGHGAGFVGHAFLNGTAEYRFCVDRKMMWLVGFVDGGRMWYWDEAAGSAAAYEWQLDAGVGFAIETPLGFPVRLDVAHGIAEDAGWKWGVYLDYDF